MTFHGRRPCIAIILVVCFGLAGCSSSDSVPDTVSDAVPSTVPEPVPGLVPELVPSTVSVPIAVDDDDASSPTDTRAPKDETVEEEPPATAEPLRPAGEPQPTTAPDPNSTSAYISRLLMTSHTIEVNWSDSEGVAEYHIHRLPRTSDDEPPVEAMTENNRIHVAYDRGRFADENVDAGVEYWHGVREISADGDITAHGWHPTAAIDDEQPPSVVDGITAVAQDGGVLVTWTEPDENYQLHAYRVFRGVDGELPESIAVTWNLDQVSFFDDEPPTSAQVVYEVVAMDFHWNRSSPGGVTIDLS